MRTGVLFLVLSSPLFLAWIGSGDGSGRWSAGEGKRVEVRDRRVSLDVVARVRESRPTHLVTTIPLPGADGVLTVVADGEGRITLPGPGAKVQYDEYDRDGEIVFRAGRVEGELWTGNDDERVEVELRLRMFDVDRPDVWRTLDRVSVDVESAKPEPKAEPAHHDHHHYEDSGCESGFDDDAYEEDGDEGYGGGGCEGDDLDSGESGGGCEGDDLDSDDGGGCEGDAIAAPGARCRNRRSPLLLRALNWFPYLAVFGFIRVMRRRIPR